MIENRIMYKVLLILIVISGVARGQSIDYDKIIFPVEIGSIPFEEKLVRLAWQNNPANQILEHQMNIAERKIKLAKFSWLDDIKGSYNYNNNNNSSSSVEGTVNNTLYPRYNVGVSVSLGKFFTVPTETKIAQEELFIEQEKNKLQKLYIRNEILKRYEIYQMKMQLLKVLTQAAEDSYSTHLSMTRKFQKGEVPLEEFNTSANAYAKALEGKIIAESEVRISKLSIEELIGIKLEEVKE